MIKFLRISSIYPVFLKKISKNFTINDSYEKILQFIFEEKYSVSNYISEELRKKNYLCNEIIYNCNLAQEKWMETYGKKNGEDVILQQIKFYSPDILFLGDLNLSNDLLVKKIRDTLDVKLILAFHCAPFMKKHIVSLKNVDAMITCTEGYRNKIISLSDKKVLLMQHAYKEDDKERSSEKNRNIDVGFIGSIFLNKKLHLGRVEIIYELIRKYKNNYIAINFSKYFFLELTLFIFKSIFSYEIIKNFKTLYKILYIYIFCKKPVYGKNMLNILKKIKILINKHIEDTEFAGNMRLFEATGSGCLLMTDNKKDLDKLFVFEQEILIFENIEDLKKKIDFYLKNKTLLSKIAINGRKKTLSIHNYQNRVNELDVFIKSFLAKNENI